MKTKTISYISFISLTLLLTFFIGCKKNQPDQQAGNPANKLPVADAGAMQTILLPLDSVRLSGMGSDSDGRVVSWLWKEVSGPNLATIVRPDSASTQVRGLIGGSYTFQLTVIDDKGATGSDTVSVKVVTNLNPVANAGSPQTITLPLDSVRLTGSGTDADGNVVSYLWREISGPNLATIVQSNAASTSVRGLVAGLYSFQLTVVDNKGATGSDTVSVKVNARNQDPVADAGSPQTIILPLDSVRLTGSGTDADGNVVSYSWREISGPNQAIIVQPNTASTLVRGLVVGLYSFQLTVVDDKGASASETVSVTVKPAIVYTTITLQPHQNPTEVHIWGNGYNKEGSHHGAPELGAAAWTHNSDLVYERGLFKFNLSSIPADATITSAKLTLYSNPTPFNGNLIDANYGSNNTMLIQRVTSSWTASLVKWVNQPSTTTTNQIVIPHTNYSFLDLTDVDVTGLTQTMFSTNTNYGFMIRLQTESIYNSRLFSSSFHANAAKHPKLVITYKTGG